MAHDRFVSMETALLVHENNAACISALSFILFLSYILDGTFSFALGGFKICFTGKRKGLRI